VMSFGGRKGWGLQRVSGRGEAGVGGGRMNEALYCGMHSVRLHCISYKGAHVFRSMNYLYVYFM